MGRLLFLALALSFTVPSLASPVALINSNLKAWYQQETSVTPGPFFGIYKVLYHNNKVYLGIGTDRPASQDGAMLARLNLDGTELTNVAYLYEQGFIDMMIAGDYLHIPGADPAWSEDPSLPQYGWDHGNWYRMNLVEQDPQVELKRNLPFVVHGWGHWFDQNTQTIYHATSRVTCPVVNANGGCFGVENQQGGGAIFTSKDLGDSWSLLGSTLEGLGNYRTYDVEGTDKALFAVWADHTPEGTRCGIAYKKHLALKWERVKYLNVPCIERLVSASGLIFTLSQNGPYLVIVSEDYDQQKTYNAIQLPARRVPGSLNHIAITPKGEVVFASREGLYKTSDLKTWEIIPGTENITQAISMTMIPELNTLLIATPQQVYKIGL